MPEESEDVRIGFRVIAPDRWRQFYVQPERVHDVLRAAIREARQCNNMPTPWMVNDLQVLLDPDSAEALAKLDWVRHVVHYCRPHSLLLTEHDALPRLLWGALVLIGYKMI